MTLNHDCAVRIKEILAWYDEESYTISLLMYQSSLLKYTPNIQ